MFRSDIQNGKTVSPEELQKAFFQIKCVDNKIINVVRCKPRVIFLKIQTMNAVIACSVVFGL